MFNLKFTLITLFTIVSAERDYDGSYNYLLHAEVVSQYDISYNSLKPLPFEQGESFRATIPVDCEYDYAVDEAATEKWNQWITYRAYICNAKEIQLEQDLPKIDH